MNGERDVDAYTRSAFDAIGHVTESLRQCNDAESALATVTRVVHGLNGDRNAHRRAGALKPGERQFFVAGVFLVTPDESHHVLVAEQGFPPEQHRLTVPIGLGHPGQVFRDQEPLLLSNTDDHADFEQILKTARMGSAIYAPMVWKGRFLGQVINAAQARNTMAWCDLRTLVMLAQIATLAYVAMDGERQFFT